MVGYTGLPIDPEGLLSYLVSYRRHTAFHEDTVERIFVDIMARCRPDELTVYGRFLRRGGLDINPFRSTQGDSGAGDAVGAAVEPGDDRRPGSMRISPVCDTSAAAWVHASSPGGAD